MPIFYAITKLQYKKCSTYKELCNMLNAQSRIMPCCTSCYTSLKSIFEWKKLTLPLNSILPGMWDMKFHNSINKKGQGRKDKF